MILTIAPWWFSSAIFVFIAYVTIQITLKIRKNRFRRKQRSNLYELIDNSRIQKLFLSRLSKNEQRIARFELEEARKIINCKKVKRYEPTIFLLENALSPKKLRSDLFGDLDKELYDLLHLIADILNHNINIQRGFYSIPNQAVISRMIEQYEHMSLIRDKK